MNASTPMNKFGWLVKREYWEYRGGFFWAPVITAMVMLGLMLLTLVIAETTAHRAGISLNGMHFDEISARLSEGNAAKLYAGLDMGLLGLGVPVGITLFFVSIFYGIGALYNDRADRSVLFWKSLPVSDMQTVFAKVFAMALLAPAIAVVAVIALQLGFLLIMSLWVLVHGINPLPLWSPVHLMTLWIKLIVLIPFNALWALPTIGWLLLCSSFARSKPFLWAVVLPVLSGIFVSMFGLMRELSLSSGWYWRNVVGRLLLSVVPGSWMDLHDLRKLDQEDQLPDAVGNLASFDSIGHLLSSPNFLIGVVAGVAMIAAAVYFRRERTESYA